jgi:hypothetical protein
LPEEMAEGTSDDRKYIFRGNADDRSGSVGRKLGGDADAADIQNFADHVLRKESHLSSKYTSFTTETRVARRFPPAPDNRYVSKVDFARLRELESQGEIRIWDPDQVFEWLRQGPRKLAKRAADVRTAMRRNGEILIEGQIPAGFLEPAN